MSKPYQVLTTAITTTVALIMVGINPSIVKAGEQEAVSAYQVGDYQTAAKLWKEEAEANRDTNSKIVALSNLASTYLKLNQVNLAQGVVDQNLQLLGQQERIDSLVYAQALLIAGNVAERKGNTNIAVEHWVRSRDIYQNKDLTGYIKSNLNLVKGYSDLGLYNRLSKELDSLELVTNKVEDIDLLTKSLLAMGNAYQLIGNYDKAQLRIQQAVELAPGIESNIALANLYKYQGDYNKAQAQLDAIVQRRSTSTDEDIYQANLQQMQLALHQKKWSKALKIGQSLQGKVLTYRSTTLL